MIQHFLHPKYSQSENEIFIEFQPNESFKSFDFIPILTLNTET
jgi:hypothetical protein